MRRLPWRGSRRLLVPGRASMLDGMRATVLLLPVLCLPLIGLQATEAWRSVDAQGNVEYSDTPRPGAQRIELPAPRTVPARIPARAAEPSDAATEAHAREVPRNAVAYREIAITDPENDGTLSDNSGNLFVSIHLEPALQKQFGHRVELLLDGVVYATDAVSNFTLTEIERGTHTLQAVVLGIDEAPLATSAPVTFHLHRASVRQIERQRAAKKAIDGEERR